jgi:hypothetical protein
MDRYVLENIFVVMRYPLFTNRGKTLSLKG